MKWKTLALLVLMFLMLIPVLGHADTASRGVGVTPGMYTTYDHYGSGVKSVLKLLVYKVDNTTIVFNATETSPTLTTTTLLWTNVDGSIYITQSCNAYGVCGSSTDTTKVGTLHFFIGANLYGGPEYKGSATDITKSLFGKIVLGNWRETNYVSLSAGVYTSYGEWDKSTGIMTSLIVDFNGAGDRYTLTDTNAWKTHIPAWDAVYTVEIVGGKVSAVVFPMVGYFTMFYVFSFMFVGLRDYFHIKKTRQIRTQLMPIWLKYVIVGTLISVMMWIAILFFVFPWIMSQFYR